VQNMRNSVVIVCGLAATLLLGCQNDEIRSYRVPKPEPTRALVPSEATRLLAAIIPHGQQTWFFKLVGPVAQVDEQKEPFDQFIRSVRFTDNAERPITWTKPNGWRERPGAEMRYATFYVGPQDQPQLTVFKFSGPAGSVLDNINRWRGQIGLGKIQEGELDQISTKLQLECGPATLVDMTSHGAGKTAPVSSPDILSRRAPSPSRLRYDIPKGWKETPDPSGISAAVFEVSSGAAKASITSLPRRPDELLENVNRWRKQLHLGPIDDKQLGKDVQQLEVAGTTAHYVDLTGPGADGTPPQRMLGVMLPRGEGMWFFKIIGPADVVEKQKSTFEAFVKSVRFDGGKGS
jgi:hypothetical protein